MIKREERGQLVAGIRYLCSGCSISFGELPFVLPFTCIRRSRRSTRFGTESRAPAQTPRVVFGIWLPPRDYVADAEEWSRFSPLALIEIASAQQTHLSLYLWAGLCNRCGLFEGTERLARRAAQRGVPSSALTGSLREPAKLRR
jgi:hypothetical protein